MRISRKTGRQILHMSTNGKGCKSCFVFYLAKGVFYSLQSANFYRSRNDSLKSILRLKSENDFQFNKRFKKKTKQMKDLTKQARKGF